MEKGTETFLHYHVQNNKYVLNTYQLQQTAISLTKNIYQGPGNLKKY